MIRAVAYAEARDVAEAMNEEMKALYESDEGATPVAAEAFLPPGTFLVLTDDGVDVACGGLALLEEGIGEIKRLYVDPAHRGRGLSRMLLKALMAHARDVGLREVWLETGTRQLAAVALYTSEGFEPIPPYGYWKDHPETLCFRLLL